MKRFAAKGEGYAGSALSLPQPDPAVLKKAQQGDREAFASIVRAYETPIFNYIVRLDR